MATFDSTILLPAELASFSVLSHGLCFSSWGEGGVYTTARV